MKNCCKYCLYWISENNKQGLCRRNPPMPMVVGMGQQAIVADPAKSPMIPIVSSYFPQMMFDGWCGEFSGKLSS